MKKTDLLKKDFLEVSKPDDTAMALSLKKIINTIDEGTKVLSTHSTNLAFHVILEESDENITCLKLIPDAKELNGQSMLKDFLSTGKKMGALIGTKSNDETRKELQKMLGDLLRSYINVTILKKEQIKSVLGPLYDNFLEEKYMVELISEKTYFIPDQRFVGSLGQVIDWKGKSIIDPTEYVASRFTMITKLLFETPKIVKLVYRTLGAQNQNYLFYCGSERYMQIPQITILSLFKEFEKTMGTSLIKYYEINHCTSTVFGFFPEETEDFSDEMKALNITPGLEIKTSDVGASSFTVRGAFVKDDKIFYMNNNSYARKHSGDIDFDELKEFVERRIFTDYHAIPTKLIGMSKIFLDISDPDKIKSLLLFVSDKAGLVKLASKSNEILIRELLLDMLLSYGKEITAYELFTLYLETIDSLVLERSVVEKLRTFVSNLIFVDFTKY